MEKKELLVVIDYKRQELHGCVNNFGISSKEALKCSEELDILINKYQKLNNSLTNT